MKKVFVRTSNYEAFCAGVLAVEGRGAAEAGMLLVTGPAGLGKSECVDRWAIERDAVYVRAKATWSKRSALEEIANVLRLDTRGRTSDIQNRIITYVGTRQTPLVIDEAEFTLNTNATILEAIRDISDLTEVMVVLVGMEKIENAISRYAQISSRIAQVVNFRPATLADVAGMCAELTDITITDDLVKEIHRQSEGRLRLVLNAISNVEQLASRNRLSVMGVADMGGKALVHDWQAKRRVGVK